MKHPFNRAERRETKKHYARKDFFKTWYDLAKRATFRCWGYWNDNALRDYKAGKRRYCRR